MPSVGFCFCHFPQIVLYIFFLSFPTHIQLFFPPACFSPWLTARYISLDNSFYWFEIIGWNVISLRCSRKARVFRLNKVFLGLKLLYPQWDLQLFAKMRCYCLPRWPTFTVDGYTDGFETNHLMVFECVILKRGQVWFSKRGQFVVMRRVWFSKWCQLVF